MVLNAMGNGQSFKAEVSSLTSLFGMKGLDCIVVEVEAGKIAFPYHFRLCHEKLFVIREGQQSNKSD